MFLGPAGTGKSHLAQAIGQAAIQQGYRVLYRETHVLLDELAEASSTAHARSSWRSLTTVPLLIIDDFGMRKLPLTAAEDLLEIVMRRYERASTLLTSNRPVEDWGKLLGDVAAVTAMLDRLLHHGHVLKCGPRSWRTKMATGGREPMTRWADFAAVKQAATLEAVLRHYQIPGLRLHRDQLQGCCPIHRGQRNDSFRVHLTKNIFQCFACQAHGNVLDFVVAMEQCSIREAALRLQQWFGIRPSGLRLYPAAAGRQKGKLVRKEEGSNRPLRFALTGVERNHPYLAQRGIDPATAAEFGVGFYPGPGLMSGRIVIPICNLHGQLVAYAGRALDDRPPKYKLPAGFRKAAGTVQSAAGDGHRRQDRDRG